MSNFSKLSKKAKSIIFVSGLVLSAASVFAGLILTDYATKPFWWTFWDIVVPVGILSFLGLIFWKDSQKETPQQK